MKTYEQAIRNEAIRYVHFYYGGGNSSLSSIADFRAIAFIYDKDEDDVLEQIQQMFYDARRAAANTSIDEVLKQLKKDC